MFQANEPSEDYLRHIQQKYIHKFQHHIEAWYHQQLELTYPSKISVKLWFIPVGSTSRASLMASDVAIS